MSNKKLKQPHYTLYTSSRAVPKGKGAVYKQEIVVLNDVVFFRTEGKREVIYAGGSFTAVQWKKWRSIPTKGVLIGDGYLKYKNSTFTQVEWDGKTRRLPKVQHEVIQESNVEEYDNNKLTQGLELLKSIAQSVYK